MRNFFLITAAFVAIVACSEQPLHLVTTGDMHGAWFNKSYIEPQTNQTSLMSVMYYVDSLRSAVGRNNVILLDAGDCLQGDNAAYYYNYIDTLGVHPFVEIADYMGYDAMVVGNHDIETGHPVYDKLYKQLKARDISWLGGNSLKANGETYFPAYKIVRKTGRKVAIIGFTNPNIKSWLSEDLWSGMEFVSLLPFVQESVDKVIAAEKPDIVIVATHSGTGNGDGESLENQGLDLLQSLNNVDIVVCAHDHRPLVKELNGIWLVNAGQKSNNITHSVIDKDIKFAELVKLDRDKIDTKMSRKFEPYYTKVKDFTLRPMGTLSMSMRSRDSYEGMSNYINLIHTVQLGAKPAQISMAAPLSYNKTINKGQIVYNDMFTIYPFENQLYVLSLSGKEIKDYLEYSYNSWIQTSPDHVLRIKNEPDPRSGADKWSFVGRSYNFDSAAGLNYTVDVSKPFGSRISISSLADGSEFILSDYYNVAMTSYRASGGGNILFKGAGLSPNQVESRIIAKYPAIRDMVCDFFEQHKNIGHETVSDTSIIGCWSWLPEGSSERIKADMGLLF